MSIAEDELDTEKGLCRSLPFENLTGNRVNVEPGMPVVEKNGEKRAVASLLM